MSEWHHLCDRGRKKKVRPDFDRCRSINIFKYIKRWSFLVRTVMSSSFWHHKVSQFQHTNPTIYLNPWLHLSGPELFPLGPNPAASKQFTSAPCWLCTAINGLGSTCLDFSFTTRPAIESLSTGNAPTTGISGQWYESKLGTLASDGEHLKQGSDWLKLAVTAWMGEQLTNGSATDSFISTFLFNYRVLIKDVCNAMFIFPRQTLPKYTYR